MAKLKRTLGLLETTFYGVGVILGAGIYALIGEAAGLAGNAVWLAFAIGALISAFTGLSYAELASLFPKAGGEYVYTEHAINKRLAFLVGWMIIASGVIAAATISLGFAGYFNAISKMPVIPIAILLIALLSVINYWGINESAFFNTISTLIEIGGLILIIAFGLKYVGNVNYFTLPPAGISGILGATALIFFAFLGFEDLPRLSEETKNPAKTIPQALMLSILISSILYIAVAVITVSVLGWQNLASSSAPLAQVAAIAINPKMFFIVSVIALFATFNTVLVTLIAASRMVYGMAEEHALPLAFSKVSKKTQTPWEAIIVVGILSALFVLIGKIGIVASLTDFGIFLTFALVNISLIILRYKMPNAHRTFKVPINIGKLPVLAVLGAATSVFMLFQFEWKIVLAGFSTAITGLLAYELVKRKNKNK